MCGTASVSEALRVAGYRVIAADMMSYAFHHANVRLKLEHPPCFSRVTIGGYFSVLQHLEALPGLRGHFYREYSPEGQPNNGERPRMYFSAENAASIDAITYQINEWSASDKISDLEESLLRHDLILAANRVANIAGTYGHYRSTWSASALTQLTLRPSTFLWGLSTDHSVHKGQAEQLSGTLTADLCYIDPPYMKRQYAANYHIIETIARGDAPEAFGVSGLRPWRDQYSDFCSKVRVRDSFRKIIREMSCPKFLISYSEDGLLSKEELNSLFSEFGDVEFEHLIHQRFKSNTGGSGGKIKEYLFKITK
jgi:adenine-specific DNA-methyltransferase